ncbi:serine hydrolase [Streptomyces avermitilis]|uniref:Beta-lactamase n=3 Tax=Streptomyces avermitilis TaxID=33903 RepID=Q82M77_STRAW|nr:MULTISPECIES: serine hydrolase domain-containing protein [Streptomyces]KUN55929.1 serine hydrolase [Streptomyces avermitilis]MYS97409.1 serine hydrolase [Streptomyces sp. SID5469]OOV25309.1 serine hydrolase [Streptomyces avermitilis]BAC69494.1 putative beta-lactamase [Streptomyces avermitilis MA-4680 = NBRC 14893]BBJ49494.1 serine hydrolase [Streptomyces avermitilis]
MGHLRQEAEPGEVGLDPKALARLDQHFAHEVDDGRLPGFLVSVSRHGRVAHLTTYGHRDRAAELPVETDTLWRMYSMTKPVTSVAALILMEEGRFGLDTPVAEFLPSFAEPRVYVDGAGPDIRTRPAGQPILIRHLLTHTAGLTFGFYHCHPVDARYREAGIESSVPPGADLAEACEVYAGLPLQFEPGTRWNYSVATNVLGRLIEVVSGRPLDDFFADRVLTPLGMTDAGFCVTPEQASRLAELYGETEDGGIAPVPGLPLHGRPRFLSGSGGLVATAYDYHRFMEFLRRRGELDGVRLLAPRTVAMMTANQLPGGADRRAFGTTVHQEPGSAGLGFGLGVSVVVDPGVTRSPSALGSYGWNGVATTTFWVDPHNDMTVQFLTQVRPTGSHRVYPELKRLIHESLAG